MSFYTNVDMLGNSIFVRGINEDGTSFQNKNMFKPSLWVECNDHDEESIYKSVRDIPLRQKEFDSIKDARDYVKSYSQFHPIYGSTKFTSSYIEEFFSDRIPVPDKIRIAIVDIEVYSPDEFPKPAEAAHPINAITHYDNIDDTYYVFHLKNPKNPIKWSKQLSDRPQEILDKIEYAFFETEEELLCAYVNLFDQLQPNIFTGWNSSKFDTPYIVNRTTSLLGDSWTNRYSVWRKIKEKQIRNSFGGTDQGYQIFGLSDLDYMEVYKKQTFTNQEFYSLDHISHVELGERKVSYEESMNLAGLYDADPVKFIDYNIHDVVLVKRLEDKLNLIKLVIDVSYHAGINYTDTFSPIRTWESILYNDIVPRGIIPPVSSGVHKSTPYDGGHVKVPLSGMFKNIASFDLTSLYPSIIRQWNISPDKINNVIDRADISELLLHKKIDFKDIHNCIAGNGVTFKTDSQGFLARQMENLFNERKHAKSESFKYKTRAKVVQEQINKSSDEIEISKLRIEHSRLLSKSGQFYTRQWALKVLLNSAYGALASPFFCFYDINLAEAVTLSGQLVIKWSAKRVNEYVNKICDTRDIDYNIYIDTDSIYFNFDAIVQRCMPDETDVTKIVNFLDSVCKNVEEKCLKPCYVELKEYLNCFEQVMNMDREVIATSGFWTAKKRYALLVHDNEGERYSKPKLKIVGLEIVKKDTPQVIRTELKKLVGIILETHDNDTLKDEVAKFKEDFVTSRIYSYDEIATVKTVNNIKKYIDPTRLCKKGTPKNSRSAIIFNNLLKQHDVNRELISEGTKINMVNLSMPNPISQDVIGYVGNIPPEFNLDKYIDFPGTYEKSFENPLIKITDSIGWAIEDIASFDDFF